MASTVDQQLRGNLFVYSQASLPLLWLGRLSGRCCCHSGDMDVLLRKCVLKIICISYLVSVSFTVWCPSESVVLHKVCRSFCTSSCVFMFFQVTCVSSWVSVSFTIWCPPESVCPSVFMSSCPESMSFTESVSPPGPACPSDNLYFLLGLRLAICPFGSVYPLEGVYVLISLRVWQALYVSYSCSLYVLATWTS